MSKRPLAPVSGLRYPPKMPAVSQIENMQLRFTQNEVEAIRVAMAIYTESRQPKVTWEGWKAIGRALEIAKQRAARMAMGNVTSRGVYGQLVGDFLRKSGFTFINKGVQDALKKCLGSIEEIDAWRQELPERARAGLNNPIDVWDQFSRADRTEVSRIVEHARRKRDEKTNQLLDEFLALQEALAAKEGQIEELRALLEVVAGHMSKRWLEKQGDDTLRTLFPFLSPELQDQLHERLYPEEK